MCAALTQPLTQSLEPMAIDIGECQRNSVRALLQLRSAQRKSNSEETRNSFLARASALFGRGNEKESICNLVDRQTSLESLKRTGIIPEDIIQGGGTQMTFKRLTNAYPIQSLVKDFGFQWHHFVQLGFETDDLRNMEIEDFRCIKLTAVELMRDIPLSAVDLVRLKIAPYLLRELGFTFDHFIELHTTRQQLDEIMSKEEMSTYFHPTQNQLSRIAGVPASAARSPRQISIKPGQLTF